MKTAYLFRSGFSVNAKQHPGRQRVSNFVFKALTLHQPAFGSASITRHGLLKSKVNED